jgi:hypothetical protein
VALAVGMSSQLPLKPHLEQLSNDLVVEYYIKDEIAYINYVFPGATSPQPVPVMLDLQQGQSSAWNCPNSTICQEYGFLNPYENQTLIVQPLVSQNNEIVGFSTPTLMDSNLVSY